MPYKGVWLLDVDISATDISTYGMPSGKCVVLFGGVPMSGTIDPASSGTFGPTGRARVVGGANGWSTATTAQDWHSDAPGVLSTAVYAATGAAVGETVVDLEPTVLGTDFARAGNSPMAGPLAPSTNIAASAVFGDNNWFVDVTGVTFVGPRPPAVPDPSLVIRDWDPIHQKATFSCDTLVLPGTPLVDPRFGVGTTFTVYNVEQVFDANGSTGWAWSNTSPVSLIVDDLKSACLYWTRANFLRVYRYRLITYQGDGPSGGPERMALQAVTPTAGVPDLIPVAPFSGVAGMVSELAPSQEVLVVFENADPTLPRVISFNITSTAGQPLGLPLKTTMDAQAELDLGVMAPLVNIAEQALAVNIAGGLDSLVLNTPYQALLSALSSFASTVSGITPPTTLPQVVTAFGTLLTAASSLKSALSGLPPAPTTITKAT